MNKKIILSSGDVFIGKGFGSDNKIITELVFNTSMIGYQEILSDNSYCKQGVVMTYPMIGNYGINDKFNESTKPFVDAIIVKEYCKDYSHFETDESLEEYLNRFGIVGIHDIDTRALTRVLRDKGSQLALIVDVDYDTKMGLEEIKAYKNVGNEVEIVSTSKPYVYENTGHKLVVIDFGIKLNILRSLHNIGFNIVVLPHDSTYKTIMSYKPDGVFLSNGPGNPQDVKGAIELIKKIQKELPIFGICLGHQIIALANDCEVTKMKFGHRGGNHPVKNLITNKIEITSQNHSYAVTKINNEELETTHINLLDNTCEGLKHKKFDVFSVQYHPESSPGPEDSAYLFTQFYNIINQKKGVQNEENR